MIIQLEHTRFVKGWYILDNIIIIWEGIESACSSNHDALLIKIDFEKTYDKIEWFFITTMLSTNGFGSFLISLVKMLFRYASIVLTMNGSQSQRIILSHSIF